MKRACHVCGRSLTVNKVGRLPRHQYRPGDKAVHGGWVCIGSGHQAATIRETWTAKQWARCLVDYVSTVTQLDPKKGELPNVDDWRRSAEVLFRQILERR